MFKSFINTTAMVNLCVFCVLSIGTLTTKNSAFKRLNYPPLHYLAVIVISKPITTLSYLFYPPKLTTLHAVFETSWGVLCFCFVSLLGQRQLTGLH